MSIRIQPYLRASGSAKEMSEQTGVLRTKQKDGAAFTRVINWGSSRRKYDGEYINQPEAVTVAGNKLRSARAFKKGGVPCAEYTESQRTAQQWLNDGHTVVCRTKLRSSQGRGVVVANKQRGTPLVPAALYNKYVEKQDEYRVHVAFGEVIDIAQKRKRRSVKRENMDYEVRTFSSGWVYCRQGIAPPDAIRAAGLAAVESLGLDFGGVDIGVSTDGTVCVYEVNTAPGIMGTTAKNYAKAFIRAIPELQRPVYANRREATMAEYGLVAVKV
jgi:glutathione synthase/RimK-type ligase-like ATP-grasp enzyme